MILLHEVHFASIMLAFCGFLLQTSQLGSGPGRENASNYSHAAVKPCRAHVTPSFKTNFIEKRHDYLTN